MDDNKPIIDVTPHPSGSFKAPDTKSVLRRRKGVIAFFWVLFCAVGFWYLISRDPEFEAESRIMVLRAGAGAPVSEAELTSEIELVRDPAHVAKVAAKQVQNASQAMTHHLEEQIASHLSVSLAGKSNLLEVAYRDPDPAKAARIVNQFVDLYLAERRSIFQGGGASDWTQQRASDLLSAFDTLNHGMQLRGELEARARRRMELESRVEELKAGIRDAEETGAALAKRVTPLPDRVQSGTRTRPVSGNGQSVQVEETEALNPLKQQLASDLLKNESSIAGMKARLEETRLTLQMSRIAEDKAGALAAERDKLLRQAQMGFTPAADSPFAERSSLRAALIGRAEPPYAPTPVHYALWIPILMFAALVIALLIAWIIDWFDRPIYTPEDFERASGAPRADRFARGAGA